MRKLLVLVLMLTVGGCTHTPVSSRDFVRAGYYYALRGDAEKSKANYEKALATGKNLDGVRVSYGWALFNLRLFDAALAQWKLAKTGIDRDATNIEVCLALAYFKLGRKKEAFAWYALQVARDGRFGHIDAMRSATASWTVLERDAIRDLFEEFFQRAQRANKAPEPTTMAVTLRASSPTSDLKSQNQDPNPARSAPAMVVAHL